MTRFLSFAVFFLFNFACHALIIHTNKHLKKIIESVQKRKIIVAWILMLPYSL